MAFTWKNVLIGAICIVLGNLLLEALRQTVGLPFPDWIESAVMTAIAILVWFAISARMNKARG